MNTRLTQRTPGEDLWLWRRRMHLTQEKAAAQLGVCRTTLWLWETGRATPPPKALARAALRQAAPPGYLAKLARRRARTAPHQAALGIGVSLPTYLRLEAMGAPEVLAYWAARGFTFV